ncbi:MAG: hypothetical protein MJ229_01945 [bacterium]|nr:hypothetical protein [bacterium]
MGNDFKKEKNKFELFKDKKQAILAIVVLLLFGFSLINMFSKMNQNNNDAENAEQQFADSYNAENGDAGMQNLEGNGEQVDINAQNQQNPDMNTMAQDAQNIFNQTSNLQQENDDSVDILTQKTTNAGKSKRVTIAIQDSGRDNPFKPSPIFEKRVQYVEKLPLPLVDPPTGNDDVIDKTAITVMKTSVSGILYDQYSPSAILNLKNSEGVGSDYLVSVGDTLNGYKVLSITKTKVTVKLGNNVYIAGVGEYLKKAYLDSSKNLSNINHKFGGNNVTIRVKKN